MMTERATYPWEYQ